MTGQAEHIRLHTSSFVHAGAAYRYYRYENNKEKACPLILLHGFAQSAATWDSVACALLNAKSASFSAVYSFELLGHGLSDAPDNAEAYDMDTACEALASFVAWVTRREKARPVLLGYSMGGRIALESVVRYGVVASCGEGKPYAAGAGLKLSLSGLVLESAGFGPANEEMRKKLKERNYAWAQQVRDQGVETFMDYWEQLSLFASQRKLAKEVRSALRKERLSHGAQALAYIFEGMGAHRQADEADSLSALQSLAQTGFPVRYIAGALDAKYCGFAQQLAAKKMPGVQVFIVEDAGHNVHVEQPDAFVEVVLETATQ